MRQLGAAGSPPFLKEVWCTVCSPVFSLYSMTQTPFDSSSGEVFLLQTFIRSAVRSLSFSFPSVCKFSEDSWWWQVRRIRAQASETRVWSRGVLPLATAGDVRAAVPRQQLTRSFLEMHIPGPSPDGSGCGFIQTSHVNLEPGSLI